jgi:glycogen operon protein
VGQARADLSFDRRDNAWAASRSRVVDGAFDWGGDRHPATPWQDTVICEAHVKGFSMMNREVPAHLRGTYAGLAHPASIARLKAAGATAVELLPVQAFIDERMLVNAELVNYWGYNPVGYFAPAARYAGGRDPATEFRAMVKALHAAGLEVILDVVYNHTAEGDESGPSLCWRGIDNRSYYRLRAGEPRRHDDLSGCGNTLDLESPPVLRMVMDSLRFWVREMHVDGFRFDLATALARGPAGFNPRGVFLDALRQDPALAGTKLIAEPWDIATWCTGAFPPPFAEWNDRFRDAVRGFWLTRGTGCGELARRIAGSSDLFRHQGREPLASINFVTAHDGFTLADLVAYEHKHNEANAQSNADGNNDNRSTNCGVEGPSDDPAVKARRARLIRAMLATLFVSQGVPMLPAGDEHGRTQDGNNNAYAQDNPTTWVDWDGADSAMAEFTAALARVRREHPALRTRHWFDGRALASGEADIRWLSAGGAEMTQVDWEDTGRRAFAFQLGRTGPDDTALLVLINGAADATPFVLPPAPALGWQLILASSGAPEVREGMAVAAPAESVLLLASGMAKAAHG